MSWVLALVSDHGAAWPLGEVDRLERSSLQGTLSCAAGEPGRRTTPWRCALSEVELSGEGSGADRLDEVAAALEGATTRLDVAGDGRVKRFWSFDVELDRELRAFAEDATRHLVWCLDLQRPSEDEASWRQKHNVARIPLQVVHTRTAEGAEILSRPSPSTTIRGGWSWDERGPIESWLELSTLASTGDLPMAARPEIRRCTAQRSTGGTPCTRSAGRPRCSSRAPSAIAISSPPDRAGCRSRRPPGS